MSSNILLSKLGNVGTYFSKFSPFSEKKLKLSSDEKIKIVKELIKEHKHIISSGLNISDEIDIKILSFSEDGFNTICYFSFGNGITSIDIYVDSLGMNFRKESIRILASGLFRSRHKDELKYKGDFDKLHDDSHKFARNYVSKYM